MVKELAVAAAPAVIALVLWAIVDLERYVVFAVLGAMIFPASLAQPFGTNIAAVDILLLIGLAAWLIRNSLGRAPDPWIRGNPLVLPALVFVAVNAISLAWSIKPRSTLTFTIQVIELTLAFPILFATLPSSAARLRKSLYMLIGLACIQAIATLVVYGVHTRAQTTGTYLPGLNKNALGSFLGAGLVLAYALWIGRGPGHDRVRTLLLAAMGLNLAGMIASQSRGALLGSAVGVLAVGFLLGRWRVLAVLLAAVLATLYVTVIVPEQVRKTQDAGSYNTSLIRHYAWSGAIRKIEQRPWLGTGGKTYTDALPQLYGFVVPDPDNLFLLTWAELGIPGLLALGFLLYRAGRLLVDVRGLQGQSAAAAVGAGGVALSLLVHFQVDTSWSRGETTLEFAMIGVMLAMTRLAAAHQNPERADSLGAAAILDLRDPAIVGQVDAKATS